MARSSSPTLCDDTPSLQPSGASNELESYLPDFPEKKTLTRRERMVLALMTQGMTCKETARHLNIARRTVEVYRGRIQDKMGTKNAIQTIRMALSLDRSWLKVLEVT